MSSEATRLLATEGESHRFEFKEKADAVDARVLVAAANTVVLDKIPEGFVTILVGVKEVADSTTGVVQGHVIGLTQMNDDNARRNSLDNARHRIQSRASETLPVPVGLRIIEEGVDTKAPFLRLEVAPTRAPHYTRDGHRVTRYGASTRAITDDELVEMYLIREADAFRRRFGEVAAELTGSVERLGTSVETTADAILRSMEAIRDVAGSAAGEASEAASQLQHIEMDLRDRPTSKDIIDWLEAGDEAVAGRVAWLAAKLSRQINSAASRKGSAKRRRSIQP
ncbi:hypothetical protein ABZ807_32715 [Micromonospora sp. NPDC047548]|uniref:AlbA family DNA-binding domain-containing protein n=1 Tax=Micromonospora sp. NPDC047548 TaxID=3155624 RepID=UPI00340556B8